MKLYYPPRTDNPNLNVWLAHLAKEFSDPANLFAGLGKMTEATFDWNAKQLLNVGGLSIGSPSRPGKGNLLIGDGGHIKLEAGGDIILEPSDANPALIKWATVHNFGAASTTARGLCLWPTVADQDSFRIGYDPVNNTYNRFSAVGIYTKALINLKSSYDASDFSEISLFSGDGTSYIYFQVNKNGVAKTARIYPEGYLSVDAIHVGGAADPGANNLVVDSLAGGGDRYLYTDNNGLVTAGAGYP